MEDFFRELFNTASRHKSSKSSSSDTSTVLPDYEDEDLANFFEQAPEKPKQSLLEMGKQILSSLDNASQVSEHITRAGLTGKNQEKLNAFIKKNKGELSLLKSMSAIDHEGRYLGSSWAIRSVFFSKKSEFKNQRKYAVLNIDMGTSGGSAQSPSGSSKLVLNCSKENALRIRDKLGQLDKDIRGLFQGQTDA